MAAAVLARRFSSAALCAVGMGRVSGVQGALEVRTLYARSHILLIQT